MENGTLTKEEIKRLRNLLTERLENYKGTEHIQLDIDVNILEQIIFEDKIDPLLYFETFITERDHKVAKNEAMHKVFVIDFELLKKLDLTGISFNHVDISGRNFAGTKGVEIDPQSIYLKCLNYTTLTDTKIIGSLNECSIVATNFEGSKGAEIDPQTIYGKNLSYARLIDVKIIGILDNCNIEGTVFDEKANISELYIDGVRKLISTINGAFNEPINAEPKKKIRSYNLIKKYLYKK